MIERPLYRDLVPGQRHFACEPLRASAISTTACAARWSAAGPGEACHECELGRLHHADHNPGALAPARRNRGARMFGECMRCGRSDLRLVGGIVCVGCKNREYEWVKQRNAKGKVPSEYRPPHDIEIALQHAGGRVEHRLVYAMHGAEALGRVLRDLPDGARLAAERRPTSWNKTTREFEHVCTNCGTAGLVLERRRGDALERHAWCCEGEPQGSGWRIAKVRQQVMALEVDTAAAVLNGNPDLAHEVANTWTPTAWACGTCTQGQVEAILKPGGRWRCRCRACGADSERGAP